MPKAPLFDGDAVLEQHIIETAIAGLKTYRPDLDFPQSYSDMQACVRGLLQLFDIRRLPLPKPLRIECNECNGVGNVPVAPGHVKTCLTCKGKRWIPGT